MKKTLSGLSCLRDLKGQVNACSNKPSNETIRPRLASLAVDYRGDEVFGRDNAARLAERCGFEQLRLRSTKWCATVVRSCLTLSLLAKGNLDHAFQARWRELEACDCT